MLLLQLYFYSPNTKESFAVKGSPMTEASTGNLLLPLFTDVIVIDKRTIIIPVLTIKNTTKSHPEKFLSRYYDHLIKLAFIKLYGLC